MPSSDPDVKVRTQAELERMREKGKAMRAQNKKVEASIRKEYTEGAKKE